VLGNLYGNILALQGPSLGQSLSLEGPRGGGQSPPASGVDIVLESGSVSRQHARITNFEGNYYYRGPAQPQRLVCQRPIIDRAAIAERKRRDRHLRVVVRFPLDPTVAKRHASTSSKTQAGQGATIVDDEGTSSGSTIMSQLDVSNGRRACVCRSTPRQTQSPFWKSAGTWPGDRTRRSAAQILDSLFKIFIQADRGFIVLLDPQSGRLVAQGNQVQALGRHAKR